jgi:GAF domain
MRVNTGATAATSESYYAALSEIGQLLVRAVEPPELYDAIIEVLQRRLGAMLVMIGEADHAAGWFQRVAPVAVAADMQDIYPEQTPLSLVRPSFWRGVPQIEPDLRRVPGLQRLRTAYERHDVVAAMAIPVMVFGEVRAGLVIRASDPAYFSTRLTELLQQAAASIGLGLEAQSQRHQLQRSVQQEARQRRALRLLSEMIKVVTHSPDETLLLAESSDVACRVGGYRFAWIGLFADDAATSLRLHAHAGMDGVVTPGEGLALDEQKHAGDAAVVALRRGEPCVRQYAAGWETARCWRCRCAWARRWWACSWSVPTRPTLSPRSRSRCSRRWRSSLAWACRCSGRTRRGCWPSAICVSTCSTCARCCPTSIPGCW